MQCKSWPYYVTYAMYAEIDQSGRIEDTRVNTVLAFSDEISFSLLVLAVDKRECVRMMRDRGRPARPSI